MLLDLIKNRKSVREYTEQKIPHEDLKKILEAGYYAPSWMNVQPWKFIAIENQETKDMICELSGHQPHVKNAAALIVCVADKNGWSKEEFGAGLKTAAGWLPGPAWYGAGIYSNGSRSAPGHARPGNPDRR